MSTATLAQDLAGDLAQAFDRVELARAAGYEPDDWQKRLLRSSSSRLLVNASRQSGKSLTAALLVAHQSLYIPNSLSLLVSASERQSGENFRRVRAIFRDLGWPVPTTTESALRCELANGSRIVSLPAAEGTIRGFSAPSLIVVDEASRVSDEIFVSLKPMMAVSRGKIVAASTPFGQRGWWHAAWVSAEPWERVRVPATECPRIDPAFLAEERRSLGEWSYQQEYMTEFQADAGASFSMDDILAAFDESIRPLGLLGREWQ